MIDCVQEFGKHEKKITDYILEIYNNYFTHKSYRDYKDHFEVLDNAYNMNYDFDNEFDIPVVIPITKHSQVLREAILTKANQNDPLVNILQLGQTTKEQAQLLQRILHSSFKQQLFRQRAFRTIKRFAAAYGTGLVYTQFKKEKMMGRRPIQTQFGLSFEDGIIEESFYPQFIPIHPLNYFQNPDSNRVYNAHTQGHIDALSTADFIYEIKNNGMEYYVQSNVKNILKKIKKMGDLKADEEYYTDVTEAGPIGITKCSEKFNILRVYSYIRIKGNEDSIQRYYIELVDNKVIRIQYNHNLDNIVPYSVFTCYERTPTWWGNTDASFNILQEQLIKTLASMKISSAMRTMDATMLTRADSIDLVDWQRRRYRNGYVPVYNIKENERMSDLIYQYNPQDNSIQSYQQIMNELKESAQLNSIAPSIDVNMNNQDNKYTTATSTQNAMNSSDIIEGNILECFCAGLTDMTQHGIKTIQQYFPNEFITDDDMGAAVRLEEIQGKYSATVDTSAYTNDISKTIRNLNIMTMLANLAGTGNPEYQNVKIRPYLEHFIKSSKPKDTEMEEILPPPQQMPQQLIQGSPEQTMNLGG